jgi:predicted ATPase
VGAPPSKDMQSKAHIVLDARLLRRASRSCQIVVVSHSERLIESLRSGWEVREVTLEKRLSETCITDHEPPRWVWPKR